MQANAIARVEGLGQSVGLTDCEAHNSEWEEDLDAQRVLPVQHEGVQPRCAHQVHVRAGDHRDQP